MSTTDRPDLSLVIPAYNEAGRLDQTFAELDAWLEDPPVSAVEVLLVDDGSDDATLSRFETYAAGREGVRALPLPHRGKGFAVRGGMLAAEGQRVLFSDCDFSAPLEEAALLLDAIDRGADVAIGSREALGAKREDEPGYRHLMGRGFNLFVQAMLVPGIRDTQCGFKAFTREASQAIFSRLRRYGPDAPVVQGPNVTAFDVEVLFVARKLGYRIAEVPVRWVYAEGSKVRPVRDALKMGRDVVLVRMGDLLGHYRA